METLEKVEILLVEDDEDDFVIVRDLLGEIQRVRYELDWAQSFERGLGLLREKEYAAVLTDYRLGAHSGLELVRAAVEMGSAAPVIVLTGQSDPEVDVEATEAGAADYLVKGEITPAMLERSLRYSIRQHRLLRRIQTLSLRDDLTGLYNRRGFFELAEPRMKLSVRAGKPVVLLFLDLDGLKWINDSLGHEAGDRALQETARVLRRTFRATDVIARLGGDEFVVLATDATGSDADILIERLGQALAEVNAAAGGPYELSVSVGVQLGSPDEPCSIDDLLRRADIAMYEQKQRRRRSDPPPIPDAKAP